MRISDWSSDVCSSDLLEKQLANARNQAAQVIPAEAFARLEANDRAVAEARAAVNAGATTIELTGDATGITIGGEPLTPNSPRTLTGETQIDRKSVVSGKSVSVRVELGGRSYIKKTQTH